MTSHKKLQTCKFKIFAHFERSVRSRILRNTKPLKVNSSLTDRKKITRNLSESLYYSCSDLCSVSLAMSHETILKMVLRFELLKHADLQGNKFLFRYVRLFKLIYFTIYNFTLKENKYKYRMFHFKLICILFI